MLKNIIHTLMLLTIFAVYHGNSQENPLGVMAKISGQQTKLKIVPKSAFHWLLGIDNGYIISRRELGAPTFEPIHLEALKPASKKEWNTVERGGEMYKFHKESVSKIRSMLVNNDQFLTSFRSLQRADENFKMYILITMRDEVFGDFTGLEFVDKTAKLGTEYEYRVSIANTAFESEPIIFKGSRSFESPTINAFSQDKAIRLSWVHDESSPFLAYYIERSETGLSYERMTKAPIWPTQEEILDTTDVNRVFEVTYQDSLMHNYQEFYYRLVALDAWGDESLPSPAIKSMGQDRTAPKMGDIEVRVDSIRRHFVIEWQPCEDSDVHSYFITQSFSTKGRDSVIVQGLSPNDGLRYIVENPIEMKNYYFRVGAIDTSGNYSVTQPAGRFINDISIPDLNGDIAVEVDSAGVVFMSWLPMQDSNPKGYWVFKSFDADNGFMKITDTVIHQTAIVDSNSLSLLNSKVYYYVVALDQSFNMSEPSKIVEAILPDTIPPSATYINDVSRNGMLTTLTWDQNQSEDVASYLLYKRAIKGEWKLIGTVASASTVFTYEESFEGDLEYRIMAKDYNDNIARLESIFRFVSQDDLSATFDLEIQTVNAQVQLSWNDLGARYKLYGKVEERYELIDYLDTNSYALSPDKVANMEAFYIKAFNEKGRLISISKTLEI